MRILRWLPLLLVLAPAPARAGLIEYVRAPDNSYTWTLKESKETAAGTEHHLRLTSQTWQGIRWEHSLMVYQPKETKPKATMLLFNTGGNPGGASTIIGLEIAKRSGAPIAMLFHIPNQPIYNMKEDALIAETFVRFLEGDAKDETWPLLFPMVKSLVRAMDTLQTFSKKEWNHEIKDFVITGASKRGWTTWLTGAADSRVRAIAPMVIDVLNMPAQMKHQLASYGRFSEMIHDYEERKLLPMPDNANAKKLWQMVDPYAYRDRITMPKLIVNGANDPYWTVDALNLYWDDLKGEKYCVIVPNAGHNLQQKFPDKNDPIRAVTRAVNGIAAFTRLQTAGNTMPKLNWKHDQSDSGQARLGVQTSTAPKAARMWVAQAPTRDFRKATWVEQSVELKDDGKKVVGLTTSPKSGYQAIYGELDFDIGGITYSLATQIRVIEAK